MSSEVVTIEYRKMRCVPKVDLHHPQVSKDMNYLTRFATEKYYPFGATLQDMEVADDGNDHPVQ